MLFATMFAPRHAMIMARPIQNVLLIPDLVKGLTLDPNRQVLPDPKINWELKVDEEGVVEFLCKEKGFSEKRVRGGLASLNKARVIPSIPQSRLDSFFKPAPAKTGDASNQGPTAAAVAIDGNADGDKAGKGEKEMGTDGKDAEEAGGGEGLEKGTPRKRGVKRKLE